MSDIQNEEIGTPVAEQPVLASKKAISKKLIISASAVVGVIVLLILLFTNKSVTNAFMKATKSDAGYYAWVESNYIEELADSISTIYGNNLLEVLDKSGFNFEGGAELEINPSILKQFAEAIEDNTDIDISKLSKMGIKYNENLDMENGRAQASISTSLNGDSLVSMDVIVDMEEEMAYVKVPELSSTYMGTDLSSMGRDFRQLMSIYESLPYDELGEILDKLPDKKVVAKILKRYIEIALEKVEDVEVDEVTLKNDGVSVKASSYTFTIDSDLLEEIFEAIQEKAVEDKDLIKVIYNLATIYDDSIDEDDIADLLEAVLDELIREAQYMGEFEMTVYVNGKGEIIGREIMSGDEGFCSYTLEKSGKFSYKACVVDGGDEMGIAISGDKSGSKISGDLVYFQDSSRTGRTEKKIVTLKKFDVDKIKQGEISGTIVFSPAEQFGKENWEDIIDELFWELGMDEDDFGKLAKQLKKIEVEISFEASSTKINLGFAVVSGDDKLVSFQLNNSIKKPSKVSEVKKYEEDPEEWVDDADFEGFVKKLKKTDLPDELVDLFEEELEDSGLY